MIETERDVREKRKETMKKPQIWGIHRNFSANEHASGASRASPSTAHTNGQALLMFLNEYITNDINTNNGRNRGKRKKWAKKRKKAKIIEQK